MSPASVSGPTPPAGLAPGTREHWIPWRMKVCGWDQRTAEIEFLRYEQRMNAAAWERYRAALARASHADGAL
jgi:hypothetical protein